MTIAPLPPVPQQQSIDDLVATLNDRIRRINAAFASVAASTPPGVTAAAFSGQPSGLGNSDTGYLWVVTDFQHVLAWSGSGWAFADAPGGYIAGFTSAPGSGWQLCDGSATTVLAVNAAGVVSKTSFTTPNIVGVGGAVAYPKWAAAYTGSVVAATAPGHTSAAVDAGSGSPATFLTAVDATGEPAHLAVLPYFRR